MSSNPSTVANQAPRNEPRDLQSRLYREIGISAVAAALESATYPVEQAIMPAVPRRVAAQASGIKATVVKAA